MSIFFVTLTTIVLPIMLVAAVAYGLGKAGIITDEVPSRTRSIPSGLRDGVSHRSLVRASLYFFSPALAFESLARSDVNAGDFVAILVFAFLMAVVMGVLGLGLARVLRFDRPTTSAFLLSILFVNAGNYGIPFNQFAFGNEGVARATIYFVGNSILANTLGVYIASAGHSDMRASLRATTRMPLAHAALLGLVFNALDWTLPEPLLRALHLAATAALPIMLANLGLELARAQLDAYEWRVLLAMTLKLLLAPFVAFGLANLMGMQGLTRSVSVIEAAMPTAVMASLIATEFRARSDFVTSAIFLSTLGSMITLTLLLLWLGYHPG